MKIEFATFCEAGKRPRNEDYFRVIELPEQRRTMFILCDGMGGYTHGDVASRTVTASIGDYWEKTPFFKDCEKKVLEACRACRKAIMVFNHKSTIMGHIHMGTTMVLASIEDNKITIAHTGDSRCYFLRKRFSCAENFIISADLNSVNSDVVYKTQDHINSQFGGETVARCFFLIVPK